MPNKPPRLPPLKSGDDPPRPTRPSATRRGYDSEHRRMVHQLLTERPLCEHRGDRCTGWAREGHHLVYPAVYLTDYLSVCRACHLEIEREKNT